MRGRFLMILLLTASFLFAGGCARQRGDAGRITVAVSIPPLAEFVERIGGARVHVMTLVPAGASPHTYEPTPNQLVDLSDAAVYVEVGSGIEFELGWLDRIIAMNAEMLVVDSSKGIELGAAPQRAEERARGSGGQSLERGDNGEDASGHAHAERDPHIWVSPRNALTMTDNICKGLSAVDPEHQDEYFAHRNAYQVELEALDREITRIFAAKKNRRFITYHPAWGWLARDYGLEQISIEAEGKEPTARGIEHLIALAKQLGIRSVFVSPQFNTQSAEMIAREIGCTVVHADPLARNYIENIRTVATALGEAME